MVDQRKIVSLGRSSLVVSLPKHWVKMNELKQGDVVSLSVQRDRSLAVFPGTGRAERPRETTLHIDPNEKGVSIVRRLIACYLNGYSGIKLISEDTFSVAQLKAIRRIVRILYMRIMDSGAKSVYITTLIDESKASVTSGVHRMYMISNSMCRDALNSVGDRDVALAKAVYSLDDDVDHFSFFLLRLLRQVALDPTMANQLGLQPLDCLDYQTLVHRIEQVADLAANIAKQVIMLNGREQRISDPLLKLILTSGNDVVDSYFRAIEGFFSEDVTASDGIIEHQKKVEKRDQEIASKAFLDEQSNPLIICAICSMRDSIKRIAEYAADIAEITINRSFSSSL